MKINPIETNPQAEWKERRGKVLGCSYCPPNQNENGGGKKIKHGARCKIDVQKLDLDIEK